MRRITALIVLAVLFMPVGMVQADTTPTATPYPFPAGFGPPGGYEINPPHNGSISTIYDADYPCDETLRLLNTGYYASPDPVLPLRITQYAPSGYLRVMAMVKPHYVYELDSYEAIEVTTYEDNYTTEVGSVKVFVYPYSGYHNYWTLYEVLVPAYTGYGGWLEIKLTNRSNPIASAGTNISGLFITDSWQARPAEICETVPPTVTPTPTHTNTPLPTPTGTITQTWTPTPSPTLLPTSAAVATGTPTPSPMPIYTWTPAPTSSPFPTLTPIPMTQQYATPAGGWATVSYPTMEPISDTMGAGPAFTPNATYEARLDDWLTAIAEAQLVYSDVITAHNWAASLTVDARSYYTGVTSTGTITNPTFFITKITLPIAYAKGIVRYMPNLGPLIIFLLAAFLFMVAVRLIKLAYITIMWAIEKVERLWQALPFT